MYRQRKPNRLKWYDYSNYGYYYITVCTKDRNNWFGEINYGRMVLNGFGSIVSKCLTDLPNHYSNVRLNDFIIMPNHVHVILAIIAGNGLNRAYHGLPEIVRAFKTFSSKRINESITVGTGFKPVPTSMFMPTFRWQRSYYDHIIRNEKSLYEIQQYIRQNPLNWGSDRNNPIFLD